MKLRGLLASVGVALACCMTLGCPPAEEGSVPVDISVTAPAADDNTTADAAPEAPAAEEPAAEEPAAEEPAAEEPASN